MDPLCGSYASVQIFTAMNAITQKILPPSTVFIPTSHIADLQEIQFFYPIPMQLNYSVDYP